MRRKYWMKQSRQENLIYLAVWFLLFAAPLLSLYVRTVSDANAVFDWTEVFIVWRKFAVYLLLFLVHNFLLAPLLVSGHRRVAYFSIVAVLLMAFAIFQCNSRPERPPMGQKPDMGMSVHHGPPPHEVEKPDRQEADVPDKPPFPDNPEGPDGRPPQFHPIAKPPTVIVGEHDILAIVVLILMFSANLGIKAYFRSRDDRKRLAELEKQNLEQQLEYLRYQINPHFFMNTLNNIHALIDIDPAKAQETIVELSRMMRFILYEGDKRGVPLTKEMEFIRTYIKLMQLRYTDKVSITLNVPTEVPDCTIPPLILISFIENAFKHGVSYQRKSFIEVNISAADGTFHFNCRNSKADKPNEEKGGVGLANVRKRLNLLYGSDYSLRIRDDADIYTVELDIPIQN